ncbi:MAG: sigma-70 family RNA polymerase sigma factor [Clostridiales bacterium]|nr:sigma-70 family RNA polymerase sigma factor [Clostridiales bacterium]
MYGREGEDRDDLLQEVAVALLEAVDHYEPARGKFSTCWGIWARQRIGKGRVLNSGFSSSLYHATQKYKFVTSDFFQKHDRPPSDEEVMELLGISSRETLDTVRRAAGTSTVSLDTTLTDGNGAECDTALGDMIPSAVDVEEDVVKSVADQQLADRLWHLLEQLPPGKRSLIEDFYRSGLSSRQIAEQRGRPYVSVRNQLSQSLRYLRWNYGGQLQYLSEKFDVPVESK